MIFKNMQFLSFAYKENWNHAYEYKKKHHNMSNPLIFEHGTRFQTYLNQKPEFHDNFDVKLLVPENYCE